MSKFYGRNVMFNKIETLMSEHDKGSYGEFEFSHLDTEDLSDLLRMFYIENHYSAFEVSLTFSKSLEYLSKNMAEDLDIKLSNDDNKSNISSCRTSLESKIRLSQIFIELMFHNFGSIETSLEPSFAETFEKYLVGIIDTIELTKRMQEAPKEEEKEYFYPAISDIQHINDPSYY